MNGGIVVLLTVIMILVVLAILATGIHIVRPGEIGFVYRGRKFLGHSGPAFVMSPPIVGKVYRMKAESLNIVLESTNPRMEVLLGIADPSRVPVAAEDLDMKIRTLASETIKQALSRRKDAENRIDPGVVAEDIRLALDKSFENMGLRVNSVKVGEHRFGSQIGGLASAKIPSWDDISRRYGS